MNSDTNPDSVECVLVVWTGIVGVAFTLAVMASILGGYREAGVAFLMLTVMLVMMGVEA